MKRRELVIAPVVIDDVAAILERSRARFGPDAADTLETRLDEAIASLTTFGDRGRTVPELRAAGLGMYRQLGVRPFRLISRVEPSEIWLLAIVDGRRDLEDLLLERAGRG